METMEILENYCFDHAETLIFREIQLDFIVLWILVLYINLVE